MSDRTQSQQISIEVVYASPTAQELLALEVPAGCTVEAAIDRSGIIELFPEIDLMQQKVGIFGKQVSLSSYVQAGDRIEIYRPLLVDPKEARRLRARRS